MPIIDDPDFLTNRSKQLAAAQELAHLRSRLVDLQSELLNRMHERRQIIQRGRTGSRATARGRTRQPDGGGAARARQ